MRILLVTILLLPLLTTIPVMADENDEQTLRHFKTVLWPQAYRTQDVQLLDNMLHPSFQMIDDAGSRSTKAKELDYIKNNHWNPKDFVYTIERLDIYEGKFAVIDGTGESASYRYKSSNYLIKENGQWRAIGSHVSCFEEVAATED